MGSSNVWIICMNKVSTSAGAEVSIIKWSATSADLKYLSSGLNALIPSRLSSLHLQESHDVRNKSGTIKRIAGTKDRFILFCDLDLIISVKVKWICIRIRCRCSLKPYLPGNLFCFRLTQKFPGCCVLISGSIPGVMPRVQWYCIFPRILGRTGMVRRRG